MNNHFTKNILISVVAFIILVFGINVMQNLYFGQEKIKIPLSDLLTKVENKEVINVRIQGRGAEGQLTDGTHFHTYTGGYPRLIDKLHESGIAIDIVPVDTKMNSILSILISWLPMIFLIGVWVFFMRQMNSGGGRVFGFGKSKAKLISDKAPKVIFKDVAGVDEAKDELAEIVDFLRDPSKFQQLGGKIPKGCLLIGPPGTGKTLLARAIAGEANVPFFSLSGSDFVEMFVGVGASRVRDMFEQGKKNAPCIIFIDEIDAVGRHRGIGLGGGNDEREQTLNQMLVEMDGFDPNEGVVIIAATNRPDVLDHALLRPGRFDRQIIIPNPDVRGREQILKVHLQKVKASKQVDVKTLARGTPGFSGAELANLINEAALLAARKDKKAVENEDLELAKDKVLMGVERRSMVMSDSEKELTAYHEAGHAIVGLYVDTPDPIHKITIVPRGRALGMVVRLPEADRLSLRRDKAESDIAVAMGGRVAEEIIFGEDKITSGASSDIKAATQLARAMVREWGMSKKLGPVLYNNSEEESNLYNKGTNTISTHTAELIDQEVLSLINQGYQTARQILSTYLPALHKLAKTLQEKETLTGEEVRELLELTN